MEMAAVADLAAEIGDQLMKVKMAKILKQKRNEKYATNV
jgi:hypothetical protein